MHIQHSVIIRKPLEEVEAYLIDISNNCVWQEDVTESGLLTDGVIGKGTKAFEVRNIMNFPLRTEWKITAYQPGSSFSFASTSSVAPYEGTFNLEAVDMSTKVTFSFTIFHSGFNALFDPFMQGIFSRRFRKNLETLMTILENS
ncbi:cyclase [Prosthecochloris marina]|uniref:Cyclase n=1 Tax=Prosthecochloris marina TaxID=2017681 RepID=A0A317TBA6_9CHLB|nr:MULTISPECIES: SRPBCC family protein [Prosthecochloris]PWW82976.1 cyclase [Prosthecochloris marina]UZJ41661.1 SRPBCC family protein [Prosthecochloris sp. SCSIO W1101]